MQIVKFFGLLIIICSLIVTEIPMTVTIYGLLMFFAVLFAAWSYHEKRYAIFMITLVVFMFGLFKLLEYRQGVLI